LKQYIREWQQRIGVTADGIFGPATLRKSQEIYDISRSINEEDALSEEDNPFFVRDHYLWKAGKMVTQKPSPNFSGGANIPEIIVIHYTGSNSSAGALSWLTQAGSGVSAHLLIGKGGEAWQLLPFHRRAWHAGKSEYKGISGVNNFSIGIENVGIGDEWPEAQVEANRLIIQALREAYHIIDVVGHADVAIPKGRKSDPGPLYPWEEVS